MYTLKTSKIKKYLLVIGFCRKLFLLYETKKNINEVNIVVSVPYCVTILVETGQGSNVAKQTRHGSYYIFLATIIQSVCGFSVAT